MSQAVNTPRPYDASRRQEQARQTRRGILAAATEMFVTQGYAATTVGAVAEAAGVSVETIYKAFGNKPRLVKACFDVAIAGDDEDVPLMDRDDGVVARGMAEPDGSKKLVMFGDHVAQANRATGRIQLVVKEAAASDAGAAEVWQQLLEEKRIGMTFFAQHLKDEKCLRRGVSVDEARDVLYAFLSADLWDSLVNQCGWSDARFGKWVGRQLVAALR